MRKAIKTGEAPAPALADMTQEQLIDLAIEKGVDLEGGMEKEKIIQAIIEADPSFSGQDETGDDGEPEKDESEPAPEETGDDEGQGPINNVTPDAIPVGTIRIIKGTEMVNVGTAWVPTIRENIEAGKPVTVVSQKRAGKTVFAKTGKPITFDANGRATVSAADGHYLGNIIINGKPEYTVE